MSGQTPHAAATNPYRINIGTDRYEAYMKHAFFFDHYTWYEHALLGNVSMHKQQAQYGIKQYDVKEKNAYASLIFETNFTDEHNLSAGLSLNHDYLHQSLTLPERLCLLIMVISTHSHVALSVRQHRAHTFSTPITCTVDSSLWQDCASTIATSMAPSLLHAST